MAKIKGLIWAGNLRQADDYCSFRGFDPAEYPYIVTAESIYGLQGVPVIIRIGTYWDHRDFHPIKSVVEVFEILGTRIETDGRCKWKGAK